MDFRSPQRRATSSGSINLNSPFEPSHAIIFEFALASAKSSSKNCHNWIWPVPKKKPNRKLNFENYLPDDPLPNRWGLWGKNDWLENVE